MALPQRQSPGKLCCKIFNVPWKGGEALELFLFFFPPIIKLGGLELYKFFFSPFSFYERPGFRDCPVISSFRNKRLC